MGADATPASNGPSATVRARQRAAGSNSYIERAQAELDELQSNIDNTDKSNPTNEKTLAGFSARQAAIREDMKRFAGNVEAPDLATELLAKNAAGEVMRLRAGQGRKASLLANGLDGAQPSLLNRGY